ncbi:hypothetical protein HPG69_000876 [Diceros bicornis minor]|uniref:ER membrane protein complex subunit 2 n=1 Tax=Diceros bicornis minor TaxID=77932 RepID=A0A7J7E517_DICBM|nr:hypothetical protein HPG69_000876 [Diceros bicornis minor]
MERYNDAIQLCDAILEDPTDTTARKHKTDIEKAPGEMWKLLRINMNEYLEQFLGNQEAWHELPELYVNKHNYAKKAFCLEEHIVTNPHNTYIVRSRMLKLNINNVDLKILTFQEMHASHIVSAPKASTKMEKNNMKYVPWEASQINRVYQFAG